MEAEYCRDYLQIETARGVIAKEIEGGYYADVLLVGVSVFNDVPLFRVSAVLGRGTIVAKGMLVLELKFVAMFATKTSVALFSFKF